MIVENVNSEDFINAVFERKGLDDRPHSFWGAGDDPSARGEQLGWQSFVSQEARSCFDRWDGNRPASIQEHGHHPKAER
jgi:hypothetical protein